MTNWQDLDTVKIGDYCEEIIKNYIISKYPNVDIFKSVSGKKHLIDFIVFDINNPFKQSFVECKGKPRRIKYADQGFDIGQYLAYQHLSDTTGKKIIFYFCDIITESIYTSNFLKMMQPVSIGNKDYPSIEVNKYGKEEIYFPLQSMRKVRDLTKGEIEHILSLKKKDTDVEDFEIF